MNLPTSLGLCAVILTASFCLTMIIFALQGNQVVVLDMLGGLGFGALLSAITYGLYKLIK